jgi:ABC-2 type transport system ATP-binding protein
MPVIKATKLRKAFTTVLAVDDVSLSVDGGEVFGLLGPNGAGKSTTIRMLLNILTPDSGTVTFDGRPVSPAVLNRIGYLPEERGLYQKNKLLDAILYFASLKGLTGSKARERAAALLQRFELSAYANRKIEELSKGNQQKVQFITAILHDPDLLLLDEPFAGLDPVNQILLKDILQEQKQQGKAIIFSTHQMDSAERLCDRLCLINHGKIVLEGSVKSVKQQFGKNAVRLEYAGDGSFLSTLPMVSESTVYENFAELVLSGGTSSRDIFSAIRDRLDIRKFEFVEPSLNAIFISVVGNGAGIAEPTSAARPSSIPAGPVPLSQNPRVKKALLNVILSVGMTLVLAAVMLKKREVQWEIIALLGGAALFSVARYLKIRNDVAKEGSLHGK